MAVHEILLRTPGLPNIIREGNTPMLNSIIQAGKAQGMQSMDDALMSHVKAKTIDLEDALLKSQDKIRFEREIEDAKMKTARAALGASPAPGLPKPGR